MNSETVKENREFSEWLLENNIKVLDNHNSFLNEQQRQTFTFVSYRDIFYIPNILDFKDNESLKNHILKLIKSKKEQIEVNIKVTDLQPFKDLLDLLKVNFDLLPKDVQDKIIEIVEK